MAAEKCLVAVMDRLWFHQIILFSSEPPPFHAADDTKTLALPKLAAQTQEYDESSSDDEKRPTRLSVNLVSVKGRSHSSSPNSAQKRRTDYPALKKSMSCRRLVDLELEEVKGFMDLGFIFRREDLTKRIIHLVPGLQRIGSSEDEDEDEDEDEEERNKDIIRPYLSEAWVVRSPNSPLLNLRIPAVSTAADMKKHLKCWAHTVASSIQPST